MTEWQELECPHCGGWFVQDELQRMGTMVECIACEEHFPVHPENAVMCYGSQSMQAAE